MNKLIPEWREAWRWWSVQLAALFAILAGLLTANPGLVLGLVGMLPSGLWRWAIAALIAIIVFVIPTLARLWQQEGKRDGQ